jgi:hypothetical protein
MHDPIDLGDDALTDRPSASTPRSIRVLANWSGSTPAVGGRALRGLMLAGPAQSTKSDDLISTMWPSRTARIDSFCLLHASETHVVLLHPGADLGRYGRRPEFRHAVLRRSRLPTQYSRRQGSKQRLQPRAGRVAVCDALDPFQQFRRGSRRTACLIQPCGRREE